MVNKNDMIIENDKIDFIKFSQHLAFWTGQIFQLNLYCMFCIFQSIFLVHLTVAVTISVSCSSSLYQASPSPQ